MASVFLIVLALVILASILQARFKIPAPLSLMGSVLAVKASNGSLFQILPAQFDALVLITLPMLIMIDALRLDPYEVKRNAFSLFWVAGVSVVLSVALGVWINAYLLLEFALPFAAVAALFCMLSATDPITVGAVFSNFKVPHKLKFITEGESLFNDATALVIFSIAMLMLTNPQKVDAGFIAWQSVKVIGGAFIFGFVMGRAGSICMKLSDDVLVEGAILVFFAYLSYTIAEHYHISGILALIICMLIISRDITAQLGREARYKTDTEILQAHPNAAGPFGAWRLFSHSLTNAQNLHIIFKMFEFVAIIATGMLFLSMAQLASIDDLIKHWKPIVIIFLATTAIRALMMLKFSLLSNRIKIMHNISWRWWAVLTFAGSKGAISILMVHMMPSSLPYKRLFEIIVVGNVLLSTFVYALALFLIFFVYKEEFAKESAQEAA